MCDEMYLDLIGFFLSNNAQMMRYSLQLPAEYGCVLSLTAQSAQNV